MQKSQPERGSYNLIPIESKEGYFPSFYFSDTQHKLDYQLNSQQKLWEPKKNLFVQL